jgi:alpha-L-rhamnosidase
LALTLKGRKGDYVRVRYGLDQPGSDDPVFDDAVIDSYTLSGDEPREVISPPFARRVFRCVEITGDIEARNVLGAEAIPFTDGAAAISQIESDHPLIERLARRLFRTLELLSQEVLWTGADVTRRRIDLAMWYPLAGTLLSTRDNSAQLRNSLLEIIANESDPAGLPRTIPKMRARMPAESISAAAEDGRLRQDFSGFSETLLLLALGLHEQLGDRSIIDGVYPFARRLVYALEKSFPDLIRPLDAVAGFADPLDAQIAGTALWYEAILHTARMAERLELKAQAGTLRGLADRVQTAFRSRFVTPVGLLVRDNQDAYVAALGCGLIDEERAGVALERLCELIVQGGYRPGTHWIHGSRLLDVLLDGGRDDLAWALALRTGPGSWLGDPEADQDLLLNDQGQIDTGAAALVSWLLKRAAGFVADIKDSGEGAGWRSALIEPRPPVGELFPEGPPLRWLRITQATASGQWQIEWRLSEHTILVQTRVPTGCSATVRLTDGTCTRVVSGEHVFRIDLKAVEDPIPVLVESL